MSISGIILVHTMTDAFRIENIFKNNEVECKLIPPPRHLSSDCGISVRFSIAEPSVAENMISNIDYDRIVYDS